MSHVRAPRVRGARTRTPASSWEDALVTGNGTTGALAHSTADLVRLTLCHERLFLPVADALPAPATARLLPELRALLLAGRSREAAELIARSAAAEHPGYARTRWIDPLVPAAVLSFELSAPVPGDTLRACDFGTGVVSEELPDGTAHRAVASRADGAVAVELSRAAGLDGTLRLAPPGERPPVRVEAEATAAPGVLRLRARFPDRPAGAPPAAPTGYTVECALSASGGGVRVVGDALELRGVERLEAVVRVTVDVPGTGPVRAPDGPPGGGEGGAPVPGGAPALVSGPVPGGAPVPRAAGGPVSASAPTCGSGARGVPASGGVSVSESGPVPGGAPVPRAAGGPVSASAPTCGGEAGGAPAPGAAAPAPSGFDRALDRHRPLHGGLMDRFRIDLDGPPAEGASPAHLARLVDAARYTIVSSCGGLPPTLQGVWSGTYDPPWRSGYTFDGNLFSAVAALHATGTPELMTPVFDLLEGVLGDLRENARRLYGCRGVLVPAHASTTGRHQHFGPVWSLTCWTAGAAWAARLYWDYYSHTRDRDFLRERALPFLTEAALFHEDFLTADGFVPSYSPENTPADADGQACVNATMDVAAVRDLCRNLMRAHRVLGLPGGRRWAALAARTPSYRVSPGGELSEWAGPAGPLEQADRHAHRHASHLYPLWYEPDPALAAPRLRAAAAAAVRARLDWWRGEESDEMAFGLVQLGLAAARLGLAERAHAALGMLATRYWRPTLTPTHNRGALFNVDIGGGLPAVVAAVLLGSTEGRADLLPALPPAWTAGRVEGLRGRGGLLVDVLEWERGAAHARLRSVEPRSLVAAFPDGTRRRVDCDPRQAISLRFQTFLHARSRSASKNFS
ncbi:Glycosyl hydrolase family 65, N-terminal domain [Nocardiopsis flavescens]|uniref:Glycosyl hydrolase family 65, N-terminal domain n=1 Tax=Nocardiopsis flavescens TaxID=758803 RepID=A0A1M6N1K2_9ACTN|nr:glycoside hydrolase N-terminal domain-containing protein [Nocardiopsis flavescens]SHJ89532.1 Glycosyl hydrolase family 65, N-terminal domain [Nocardiopsis flavescens]